MTNINMLHCVLLCCAVLCWSLDQNRLITSDYPFSSNKNFKLVNMVEVETQGLLES